MTRSLSIPLTDHFVWTKVLEVISKSSLLREEVKKRVLDTKDAPNSDNTAIIKKEKAKRSKLLRQIEDIQASIAEMETKYLLKKYDETIYQKIEKNLSDELTKLNDEIEQSRLKIKELGNQKKWIDWLSAYNDRIEEYENYSEEERKVFLEGIIEHILVRYDKETNEHHLKISFVMPLIDDGIRYKTEEKSTGYELVDGQKDTVIGITPTPRGKKTTPQQNYSTVTDLARLRG